MLFLFSAMDGSGYSILLFILLSNILLFFRILLIFSLCLRYIKILRVKYSLFPIFAIEAFSPHPRLTFLSRATESKQRMPWEPHTGLSIRVSTHGAPINSPALRSSLLRKAGGLKQWARKKRVGESAYRQ